MEAPDGQSVSSLWSLPVGREELPRRLRVEESGGDEVEGDADDVEDGEAVDVEDGGGEGGDEQPERQQQVRDDGQRGAVAGAARLGRHQLDAIQEGH